MSEEVGIAIEGEGSGSSQNPELQVTHEKALETAARSKNWKPLAEWEGSSEDWVTAKEFLQREKFFKRINDLKNDLASERKQRQQNDLATKEHLALVRKTALQQAKRELEEQYKQAKANEDFDGAQEAREAVKDTQKELENVEAGLQKIKEQQATQTVTDPAVQEAFKDWQDRNSWYREDLELKSEADAIGIGYAQSHKDATPEQVMKFVEDKVKKLNPEKFPNEQNKKPISKVEGGGNRVDNKATTRTELTESDLTPDQQKIMKNLVSRGVISREQYLKDMESAIKGGRGSSERKATDMEKRKADALVLAHGK